MPASVTLDHERGIRITTARGPTSFADFLAVHLIIIADPSLVNVTKSLVDLRQASLVGIKRADVARAAEQPNLPRQAETRMAIVASTPVIYGLSRMYAMMQDGRQRGEVQVFQTLDDAIAWLVQ